MAVTTFGAELQLCRKVKGLTVRELASRLGISAGYLSDIERGHRGPFPDGDIYEALAREFGGPAAFWRAHARRQRVLDVIGDVPDHVRDIVCRLVLHASDVAPEHARRMNDLIVVRPR